MHELRNPYCQKVFDDLNFGAFFEISFILLKKVRAFVILAQRGDDRCDLDSFLEQDLERFPKLISRFESS